LVATVANSLGRRCNHGLSPRGIHVLTSVAGFDRINLENFLKP
jgi:hypothetical protein